MSSNPSKTGHFLLNSSVTSRQRDKAVSLLKATLKNIQLKIQNKGRVIKVQNRAQKNPGSNFDDHKPHSQSLLLTPTYLLFGGENLRPP